jgi:hypothetical protein
MKAAEFGINGGWGGRTSALLINLMQIQQIRGQFYKDGQTKEIKEIGNFTDGYAIQKFRNDVNGVQGSDKRV